MNILPLFCCCDIHYVIQNGQQNGRFDHNSYQKLTQIGKDTLNIN